MDKASVIKKAIVIVAVVAVFAGAAIGLRLVVDTGTATSQYVQIDNAQAVRDGSEYQYALVAYDEAGGEHETAFKASRQLREDAYLRLEVMPIRGVVAWEEVPLNDIPKPARDKLAEAA